MNVKYHSNTVSSVNLRLETLPVKPSGAPGPKITPSSVLVTVSEQPQKC